MENAFSHLDLIKLRQMILGILGIYICYLLLGIFYEKLTSNLYLNSNTQQMEKFTYASGMLFSQRIVIWLFAQISMFITVPRNQQPDVPIKNAASIGFLTMVTILSQTEALYLLSFTLVMMAKSCSLISAILVGVFCSRVRNAESKLEPQKIIVGLVATIGIIAFRVFDPQSNFNEHKQVQLLGLLLVIVSLFADGFIPDFNAEIKEMFSPPPIQMVCILNKWCALFLLIYLACSLQIKNFIVFCVEHPQCILDMFLMGSLSFLGQIFIFRMYKAFKQHIVPFVIATRRIITVALSMVYYHHRTNLFQILSLLVVLGVTAYEFYCNIKKDQVGGQDEQDGQVIDTNKNNYLELEEDLQQVHHQQNKAQ